MHVGDPPMDVERLRPAVCLHSTTPPVIGRPATNRPAVIDPAREYTGGSVRRLIQPVALCVVVVLGAFPAVTLACQWTCVRPLAGQAHHYTGQNESTIHASHHPASPTVRGLISAEPPCAHAEISVIAISTLQFKVFAPIAVQAAVALLAPPIDRTAIFVAVATHSPPGARSAPLALRI